MKAPKVTGSKRLARVTKAVSVYQRNLDEREAKHIGYAKGYWLGHSDGYRAGVAATEAIAVAQLREMLGEEES